VLVSPEVLKVVYQGLLELKQQYKNKKNKEFAILCAKCIASIGLCHSFVNDPVLLKASNQSTITSHTKSVEETKDDDKNAHNGGAPNMAKSDYHNPLINMKYKDDNGDKNKRDFTLELLAVPIFGKIPLERTKDVEFACCLKNKVFEMTLETEEKPKNYYFTQFLLNMYIKTQETEFKKK